MIKCGIRGCTKRASGYAEPGPLVERPLEVFVGRPVRHDQVSLCAQHLVDVLSKPTMTRRELFARQWPAA